MLSKICAGTTHVVGCNHGIQKANEDDLLPFDNIAEIRMQRFSFRRFLETLVTNTGIQFVGEEWGLPEPSTAQILSREKGIAWANINTSVEDLDKMGIPRGYVHGPYDPADKDHWNQLREGFMLRRVQEMRKGARDILVVCGFHHLQPMAQLLANLTRAVQAIDYRGLEWYRAGIFSGDE
jgi:hypothetical protein